MKGIVLILLGSLSLAGCAQQNISGVQRVDAFMQVRIPGTIPVVPGQNKNRSHSDTAYVIFVQAGQKPVWTKAWNTGHSFRIEIAEVSDSSVAVGIEKATGKEIHLATQKEMHMYRLLLKKEADNASPETIVKGGEILLKGEMQGKNIFYTIKRVTELQSPLYQ